MRCRFCQQELREEFVDLGCTPLANGFLTEEEIRGPEVFFPLRLFVCSKCFLVQIDEYKEARSIFGREYPYFASYSKSWLAHAKHYAEMITARLGLSPTSRVIEIASNDGYLLQFFLEKGIPCLGIEPAESTARVAMEKGIPVVCEFFCTNLAQRLVRETGQGDLLIGNNVLAHVPDIHDFVEGLRILLSPDGIVNMEFPHLMRLVEGTQFDTIYHEHFSYFSFHTVNRIFSTHNLEVFDADELSTHGGSLRIYARHQRAGGGPPSPTISRLLREEEYRGMLNTDFYRGFQKKVDEVKYQLVSFLIGQRKAGKTVVGYGAAAKGNTLLNYCGIRKDLIPFVADVSPHKQGKYLPGVHIPVLSPERIEDVRPDFVLILPWNLKEEISEALANIRNWGGNFVIPLPEVITF